MNWLLTLLMTLPFGVLAVTTSPPQRSRRTMPSGEAFTLGVLRSDGVVLPFATWDGEGWSTDWPASVALELPIDLDAIPTRWWGVAGRPRTFALWADGQRIRDVVEPGRPVVVPVMCDRRLGLRTDARADMAALPPFEPLPKQGLVVSGPQPVDTIARISQYTPAYKELATTIAKAAAEAENRALKRFTAWQHPYTREERLAVPVVVEALYRFPMDDAAWGSASYVEAVKKYLPGAFDQGCGLVTSLSGWIRRSPKGEVKYDLTARITYCDRKDVTYMLPLGALKLAGKNFWVFQISGWTGEWYAVVRPAPHAIEYHAEYFAGRGCEP